MRVHSGVTKEEVVASSARKELSTNRSKVEMKSAIGGEVYYVGKTRGAVGEDTGWRRRGGVWGSGTRDAVGHGRTKRCRKMQAAVS